MRSLKHGGRGKGGDGLGVVVLFATMFWVVVLIVLWFFDCLPLKGE